MKRFLAVSFATCCLASFSAFSQTTTPKSGAAPAASTGSLPADVQPDSIRDSRAKTRPSELSVMAYLPWYYGFGIGATARYSIPIVQNGFISTLNNSVSLEPGIGIEFSSYAGSSYTLVTPYVVGTWNFYFSDALRAYGGIGVGWHIGSYGGLGAYIDGVVGGYYKLGSGLTLRGEVGYGGPKIGLAFAF